MIAREDPEIFLIYFKYDFEGNHYYEDIKDACEAFGSENKLFQFLVDKLSAGTPIKPDHIFGVQVSFGKNILTEYDLNFDTAKMKFSLSKKGQRGGKK